MPPWTPGDPWPSGEPGGAASPGWGGYVRLWIRAGLAPGRPFTMGPHANDRLDAGNVMAAFVPALRADLGERLWVDLTCDTLDVTLGGGAVLSGIFSKADAATLEVTLADPGGIYDPLNPVPPWSFGGQSRLVPGTPVEAFCEVVDAGDGTWTRFPLFTGTADSWGEDWTPHPLERRAKLVATDTTKEFVRLNRPEQVPAGVGDTVDERIDRIVTFFDWPGIVEAPATPSTVTLQETTLASSAWELVNRTLDDELGICWFTPAGAFAYTTRPMLFERPDPVLELGCPTVPGGEAAYDIVIDAEPSNLDAQMRNRVYAARTGGTSQTAESSASINRFGEYSDKRTDLGVADDAQAAQWAQTVVQLYAFPQKALENVVLCPDVHAQSWESWAGVLAVGFVVDLVRIVWAPPDRPDAVVDLPARVVGWEHAITRNAWEITWHLIASRASALSGVIFTMGPDANDRLDAGFVVG